MKEIIARVESTSLGIEDHGIFTANLHLDYGGGGQSIGGYALDIYDESRKTRVGTAYGMEWIRRVLLACGVDEWEKVRGRTILVLKTEEQDHIGARGALGIKPLPTEPGQQFLFAELDNIIADAELVR